MSIVMRRVLSNSRLSLRMGCGEQLLLSASLASSDVQHRELEHDDLKLPAKGKRQRGHGE